MSLDKKWPITAAMNFYELVATEYNAGFLDRQVANKHLAYLTVDTWKHYKGLVDWLGRSDKRFYEQWRYLCDTYGAEIEDIDRPAARARHRERRPPRRRTRRPLRDSQPVGSPSRAPDARAGARVGNRISSATRRAPRLASTRG